MPGCMTSPLHMQERGEAVRIDARMDPKQLKKLTKALDDAPNECRKGLVSAINRSVKTTNTAMQRAVTQRYNIKKSALNGGDSFKSDSSNNLIKPVLATTAKLQGAIDVRGSRLSLVSARGMITPKEPKSHKGKTMKQIKRMAFPSIKVIKGKRTRYPHSFVATGKGGTTGIFSRDKSGRLELQRTLSPANMVRETSVKAATQKAAKEALEKNVAHEIEYRLERLAK